MTDTRGRPVTDHTRSGQSRRESYAALRGARLCAWSVSCGDPASYGSPLCPKHRESANAANRDLAARRRASDQCQQCGTTVINRTRCWICSDKRRSYASRQSGYRRSRERGG